MFCSHYGKKKGVAEISGQTVTQDRLAYLYYTIIGGDKGFLVGIDGTKPPHNFPIFSVTI
jgi:hypothetical protein